MFNCFNKPLGAIARKRGLGLHMYADDAHLYILVKYVGGCELLATKRVEACVTEMSSWIYKNKLKLNDAKSKVMLVFSVHSQTKFNVSHI